jgi:hypothetical protein
MGMNWTPVTLIAGDIETRAPVRDLEWRLFELACVPVKSKLN